MNNCGHTTDDELKLFCFKLKNLDLDPLKRNYFIKASGRVQTITSIDGMRLRADRSGFMKGRHSQFYDGDGRSYDIW